MKKRIGKVVLAALSLAACGSGDQTDLSTTPRYVWLEKGTNIKTMDGKKTEIADGGYAFAQITGDSEYNNVFIFQDSTRADTIGRVADFKLVYHTPDGAEPGPGNSKYAVAESKWERERAAAAKAAAVPARQPVTKEGYGACLSEELFDQWVTATVQKDVRGMQYLTENGCVVLRGGLPVSILDTSWSGGAQIRVYLDDTAVELYTYVEAVEK